MAARRRAAPARPGRRTVGTNWARVVGSNVLVASATKVLLATVTLSNPGIGEVVRRTRGLINVMSDQGSVMEPQRGALGFIVVNDIALAAGVASLPGPATDRNDDGWFVWVPFSQTMGAVESGSVTSNIGMNTYVFDSKAMRRVEEGFAIAVIAESFGDGLGADIALSFSLLSSRIG